MSKDVEPPKVLVIFDFDGVIVDSLDFLYNTYIAFLQTFDISGSREEFEQLNGPKLSEIITFLKDKYALEESHETLMHRYEERVSRLYDEVELHRGIKDILSWLSHQQHAIALASACGKADINKVLTKFGLLHYFHFIATGDDVKNAKPAPDIYQWVHQHFLEHRTYVVEDSQNGILAAQRAGLKVIHYAPNGIHTNNKVDYFIGKHSQIKNIVTEAAVNCYTLATANKVELKHTQSPLTLKASQTKRIDELWKEGCKQATLFNDNIVCYKSHSHTPFGLTIECFTAEYKHFYAQLKDPNLALNIYPLGVSAIVLDINNHTLVGIRDNVTQYNNHHEFVPSGGISALNIHNNDVSFSTQLAQEFSEETGIDSACINTIEPFCFVFDKQHGVYDICASIKIRKELSTLLNTSTNREYTNIRIVDVGEAAAEVAHNKLSYVPTSQVMLLNLPLLS